MASAKACRYRLKSPIPALYDRTGGGLIRITLPVGAILSELPQPSGGLLGTVGVSWEGRCYAVSLAELLQNSERMNTAAN